MKIPVLFAAAIFTGRATAFWGQLKAGPYNDGEGGMIAQDIYVTDYNTGSVYYTLLDGGFDACATGQCDVFFQEESGDKSYYFSARLWRTTNGCHNIDFLGALDAHHGYCCGSLPCDIAA
ncbi:hypothetical protein N7517_004861 [Penicillium concentricum]|uniref:Uncharacterized protein n=1 Tax=Penicillium concentricum TaxID=293559 RepID=A0A9W9S7M0_9EURO|nr:uncharacterized protein N7517_004861 [Penicillium concentricum]KAJ5372855.1 hypothetical protein N7517_004861 [Penicillium concentricum]